MNMVSNVKREDVVKVADELSVILTESQICEVLSMYNHEEECDPSLHWTEIVENCINQIVL